MAGVHGEQILVGAAYKTPRQLDAARIDGEREDERSTIECAGHLNPRAATVVVP